MLRFHNYDVVFREIPGEVTLAINITNCPLRCKGCHSPRLMEDVGDMLDEHVVAALLETYVNAITCICFMGGDASPREVARLARLAREISRGTIKTAWYSGRDALPAPSFANYFDYVKIGPYVQALGGLEATTTNQRFYKIEHGEMIDITSRFHQPPLARHA